MFCKHTVGKKGNITLVSKQSLFHFSQISKRLKSDIPLVLQGLGGSYRGPFVVGHAVLTDFIDETLFTLCQASLQ